MHSLYLEMELKLKKNKYTVLTLYRDFYLDNVKNLEKVLEQLVAFLVHPRTRKRIEEFGLKGHTEKLSMIEPVDYLNMMGLVKKCWKVITDSGGLQKEAYFAKKQAIVLMPDTGWRELVEARWNKLADEENLYEVVMEETGIRYPEAVYNGEDAAKRL